MNYKLLYEIAKNTAGIQPAVGDGTHALAYKIAQNTAGTPPGVGDGLHALFYKIAKNTAGTPPVVGESLHSLLYKIAGNTGSNPRVGDGIPNLLYKIAGNTGAAAPVVDIDAQSFFTRAGITDTTQKSAVDTLVKSLKSGGTWAKMWALYPFVGGTAVSHSHNLKSSSYQITWSGNVIHDANGISNSLSGFGDTVNLYPSVLSSFAFGIYNKSAEATDGSDINAPPNCRIYSRYSDNTFYGQASGIDITVAGVADAKGFFVVSRTALNSCKAFKNGAQYGPTDSTTATALPSGAFQLLPYSSHNLALAFISSGLSDAECVSLSTAIETYQAALGRQNP